MLVSPAHMSTGSSLGRPVWRYSSVRKQEWVTRIAPLCMQVGAPGYANGNARADHVDPPGLRWPDPESLWCQSASIVHPQTEVRMTSSLRWILGRCDSLHRHGPSQVALSASQVRVPASRSFQVPCSVQESFASDSQIPLPRFDTQLAGSCITLPLEESNEPQVSFCERVKRSRDLRTLKETHTVISSYPNQSWLCVSGITTTACGITHLVMTKPHAICVIKYSSGHK